MIHRSFFSIALLVLSIGLLVAGNASAQSPFFRKHTLPAEYRNTVVTRMMQDTRGFIWLGTNNGLIRFDGINYRQHVQDSTYNIAVSALIEINDTLWVAYRNGMIGRISNEKFVQSELKGTRPTTAVTGFGRDNDNRLWLSTYGEGLFYIDRDSLVNVNSANGINDDFVYGLVSDNQGYIWAGTDNGLAICTIIDGKPSITQVTTRDGLPDNIVTSLQYESGQSILIGMESAGIARINTRTRKTTLLTKTWDAGAVTSIAVWKNDMWAGTASKGIVEVVPSMSGYHSIAGNDGKPFSRVSQLLIDKEKNIWLCDETRTILSANRTFSFYRPAGGFPSDNIQTILSSRDGRLWYSRDRNLYVVHLNDQKKAEPVPELSGHHIISLFEDYRGIIWIGTFDRGLFLFDPVKRKLRRITENEGIVNNNILSIAGRDNIIWLATLGGVSRIRVSESEKMSVQTIDNFTSENGLGSNFIYKVFVDSQNRVWFATDGKGVTVFDKGAFKNFSLADGLKSNIIYCITEDSRKDIWISSSNTGIYRFTGKAFQSFAPHNGFRDLAISSLVSDSRNNLIIVSRQGIDILNPGTGNIFYHAEEMGINDIDPNLNCFSSDSAGNTWFGTQNGIIRYSVANALQEWPETRINRMLVYLDDYDGDQHVRLNHDENHVSFDYIGFWYHDPDEVTYKIKLDGYDREWIDSRNRFVTYPNLPPGDYTFNVQSSASNYFRGAKTVRYSFTILKPFYNTTLFYFGSALVTGLALAWFVRYRERKSKQAEQQKKEKIEFQFQTLKSQVNPHFLFNSFNTLISVIEQDQDTAIEYVEKLSDFYRHILLYREKDVIPLKEELRLIDDYYFLQTKRFKDNFHLKINLPPEVSDANIPPLTLQLLVENAVKHNIISSEKPLTVEIFRENDMIGVRNNLQRKIDHEPSTGVGLTNIINRFRILTDREVKANETKEYFTVLIPILR